MRLMALSSASRMRVRRFWPSASEWRVMMRGVPPDTGSATRSSTVARQS